MAPGGMNNMSNYAAYILRKAGVSEPVARSAAPKLTLQHHEAQGVVWAKGGEVQAWQFIITGLVAAAAPVQDARPVPITVYGPGSWFGEMAEMLVLVKLGNPCLRVVMGIAQFAEALASGRDLSVTEGLDGGISIPVTQTVLAAMCGVSRAVFSEYVQPLASNGWLTISYGQIELLSIATWHRFYKSRRAQSTTLISPTIEELLAELHRASVV
jgi:CRP/FNR family cyclic AMP-dependent transcriptional regulator